MKIKLNCTRMRYSRRQAGLTIFQAAKLMKIDPAFLFRVEIGKELLEESQAEQLVGIYGCSLDWLLGKNKKVDNIEGLERLTKKDRGKVLKLLKSLE